MTKKATIAKLECELHFKNTDELLEYLVGGVLDELLDRARAVKFKEGGIGCDCVYMGRLEEIVRDMKKESKNENGNERG